MAGAYSCLRYHLVFSTKDREPFITTQISSRLHEYLGGIIKGNGGLPLAIGGTTNHVHLLVSLRPDTSVSEIVRVLKSNSSKWIHENFLQCKTFAWQRGYGAFSVSRSQSGSVKAYIADQLKHHRTRSFEDEFVEFLKRNGIEYDSRYIWG
ncbi:MAG: IS200/IS605 family transposase [Planctomycetota bacterium]|nr:MAG: IS200/IS605 family transposase [Planctomycetota bacterium]